MRLNKGLRHAGWAAFCFAAAPAAAQYRPAAPAVQLAMPTNVPAEDRTYRKNEALLDLPLLWARAATLQEAVTVEADTQSQQLAAGTVLGAQNLFSESSGDILHAFCTPRRAAERALDSGRDYWLARALLRGMTDRQICLVDSDRDGRFDQSVLVNAGPPEARVPRPIAPAAMTVAELVPISARDRIWVELVGLDRQGRSLTLSIHVEQQGHDRTFSRFGGRWGEVEQRPRLRLTPAGPNAFTSWAQPSMSAPSMARRGRCGCAGPAMMISPARSWFRTRPPFVDLPPRRGVRRAAGRSPLGSPGQVRPWEK